MPVSQIQFLSRRSLAVLLATFVVNLSCADEQAQDAGAVDTSAVASITASSDSDFKSAIRNDAVQGSQVQSPAADDRHESDADSQAPAANPPQLAMEMGDSPDQVRTTITEKNRRKAEQEISRAIRQHSIKARYSVEETCLQISRKLASVRKSDCQRASFEDEAGVSVKGVPIIVQEYPPVNGREPMGRVLLIGGIHGDELSSISIVFNWMRTLNQHHSGLFHWKLVPLLNPDGLLRRQHQRQNENGVDLNRNFPTPDWHRLSQKYWIERTKKNPRRYPGEQPLSEPESRWLAKLIQDFQPDAIVAVHAPYGILDFDGPKSAPKQLGHLHLNLLGTYPGSLGNYAGIQKQIPVVTIELPYAGIMPTRTQMGQIWVDLIGWLKRNMPDDLPKTRQAENIPVKGVSVQLGGPS